MTRTIATAAVAIALVSVPAFAERQTVSSEQREAVEAAFLATSNRFGLFTDCEPIGLLVIPPKRLVTLTQLEAAVESRLRAARLFRGSGGLSNIGELSRMISDGRGGVLFVQITVTGQAFAIVLRFVKPLHDLLINAPVSAWFAGNWMHGSTGTHGGNEGYILQALSRSVDSFLVEFLRVNEDACAR